MKYTENVIIWKFDNFLIIKYLIKNKSKEISRFEYNLKIQSKR